MSASVDRSAGTPRRRRWLIVAPLLVFALVAIGWSAAWFYAARLADREIDGWIAREAQQGRSWSCASRSFAGFPFRFELVCDQPVLRFSDNGDWRWTAARAHAVAQVWNPRHIIAEFQGPATLTEAVSGRKLEANWTLLQVSGTGTQRQIERSSLAANDYNLTEGGASLFAARHVELHMRQRPDAPGALDLAASVSGATGLGAILAGTAAPPAPATGAPAAAPPVDGALQVAVTGMPPFRAMPPPERLRLWQQAGGRVRIDVAELKAGGGTLSATGEIGLDAQRRPNGALNVALSNAPALLNALSQARLMPDFLVNLAPLLSAAGLPSSVNGAPAAAFPFVFRDGRVAFGILPLGRIGPLF